MFPLQTEKTRHLMDASNYITALFCFIADILGDFTMLILKTVSNLGIFLEKKLNVETKLLLLWYTDNCCCKAECLMQSSQLLEMLKENTMLI